LNREEKKVFVADMKSRLLKAQATFVVDYQGLNVEAINRVRGDLKKTGTEFLVIKNRLVKLASQDTETASLQDQFVGPCALAITYDDMVTPAKVLVDLSKGLKQLNIKAGQMSGKPIDSGAIRRLAELPGRDELLGQVLSAMQAVPTSLVRVLNGVIGNFLNALKAIESQKAEQTS
jgi:large subunit ribosomal protein L10